MPSLSSFLARRHPRRALLEDERGDAFGAGGAVGDRHHHADLADATVRRERLRPVQHPVRSGSGRRRAQPSGIAPGARFGQRPRADLLAARQRHEVRLLLRLAAEHRDVGRAQPVVRGHRQRHARIDARELFDTQAVVDGRHAGAAVLLGPLDAEQAERRELRHQLDGKMLRLVPLPDVRTHLGLRKLAHGAPEQLLLLGQPEVHIRYDGRKETNLRILTFCLPPSF